MSDNELLIETIMKMSDVISTMSTNMVYLTETLQSMQTIIETLDMRVRELESNCGNGSVNNVFVAGS